MNIPKASEIRPKCICCKKDIEHLHKEYDCSAASAMWDGGLVDDIGAGYGSVHDMSRYIVAICDECIDKKVEDGLLIQWRDLEQFLNSPAVKEEARKADEWLRKNGGLEELKRQIEETDGTDNTV